MEATITIGNTDPADISFVLKDGTGVAAKHDGNKWTLTLPSVGNNQTYEVYALYKKGNKLLTVGKLNVVSYYTKKETVTLVPVSGAPVDAKSLQEQLNAIYNPYGFTITIATDDALKGQMDWDTDNDGLLNISGSGFFSNETSEMKALRKLYQDTGKYGKYGYYLFVMDAANVKGEPDEDKAAAGDMPRGKQFGYLFTAAVSATDLPRLTAHELGHGIFTLEHSFISNYSGKSNEGLTNNLMDYSKGADLAAFQWNVMANPAPLTWFDNDEDAMAVLTTSGEQDLNRFINLYRCALSRGGTMDFSTHSLSLGASGRGDLAGKIVLDNDKTISASLIILTESKSLVGFKPNSNAYNIIADGWIDYGSFKISVSGMTPQEFAKYLESAPGGNSAKRAMQKVDELWYANPSKALDYLYQLDVCTLNSLPTTKRLDYLGYLGSKTITNDIRDHIVVTLLESLTSTQQGCDALYKWLLDRPKEVRTLYNGVNDENTRERLTEYFIKSTFMSSEYKNKDLKSLVADNKYFALDNNNKYTYYRISDNPSSGLLDISMGRTWGDSGPKLLLSGINPMETVGVWVPGQTEDGNIVYMPAICFRYYSDQLNDTNNKASQSLIGNVIGSAFGVGFIIKGGQLIYQIAGAVQLATSMTNIALENDKVKNALIATPEGREFLNIWPSISISSDIATMVAFIAVAKPVISKFGKDLSPIQQAGIKTQIAKAEARIASLTESQINDYLKVATKNPNTKKVMLGKHDGGGATSYIKRAGNEYTYFDMGAAKWDELQALVGNSYDELWRLNKAFIDRQKALGKEFYFSHNPNTATGFMLEEVNYLTKSELLGGLGGKIEKINEITWKIVW